MALIVIGLVIMGIGVHFVWVSRTPRGAVPLPGTVVDVDVKKTMISGNSQLLYGPTVEYRDPLTGELRRLPPASHQPTAYREGDVVTLVQDPSSGELRLPLPRPLLQMGMPFVFGGLVVALGVADLGS